MNTMRRVPSIQENKTNTENMTVERSKGELALLTPSPGSLGLLILCLVQPPERSILFINKFFLTLPRSHCVFATCI